MAQYQSMNIPVRVPLVISPENRTNNTDKDARLINCYVESDQTGGVNLYRRPGKKLWGSPPSSARLGFGVYWWNGAVYSIFEDRLYKNMVQVGTGLDITNGKYTFTSIMGASPKLVFQNGVQGYAYEDVGGLSATLHSINASYPQFTCKGLAFLDGYTFVMQRFFGTQVTPAVIWGSEVNSVSQPGDWDPLNFITAQTSPDSGVFLGRQLVYVVAMKQWSTEFFFDAGNTTGSPLGPAQNLRLPYGCASADSVQDITDVLFWLSNNREASNQVVMMDRAQLTVVSTPAIDRLLRDVDLSIPNVLSWHIKIDGHSFYVLSFRTDNITLAYDISQNRWEQWTDQDGNYLPIVASTRDDQGRTIVQGFNDGCLYYASTDYTDDNGEMIPVTIITPRWDAGTSRRKNLSGMAFVGDQSQGCLMNVQVSDDDYQTWSQPRTVNLSEKFPNLINCGTFRRRAWKFTINNNLFWRLESPELQFDIGTL